MQCNGDGTGTHPGIDVQVLAHRLDKNIKRVVTLPFDANSSQQARTVFKRVANFDDAQVLAELEQVMTCFGERHHNFEHQLMDHFKSAVRVAARKHTHWSKERCMLLGAYFSMEYSIEGAALFNPSIVPHPEQDGNGLRYVMSRRAVGEGHLSSTVFQTGRISDSGAFEADASSHFSSRTKIRPDQSYNKTAFCRKLWEMGLHGRQIRVVMDRLPETFTFDAINGAVAAAADDAQDFDSNAANAMIWLARANYELQLNPADSINDLILYPRSETESRGIEDMRLVRFTEDDDTSCYYGTYTAYDGVRILPMLLETPDFRSLKMHTLNGRCAQNKGMALFPRRINGHYCMCSRIDGQRLFLMFSDYTHFWESAELLAEPKYPWEIRLIGNCGSPVETDEGWLLLTHGVGPMRRYCIGAMLLDHDNPFKIRGRLKAPLLEPSGESREGYVPNVVYSCGCLLFKRTLYLPFAVSDMATRIATMSIDALLKQLLSDGP